MDTTNIFVFNGRDPFDNWTIKDNELSGYYPRNSIINLLSKSVEVKNNLLVIPEGVISISNNCFRNNRNNLIVVVPNSVKIIHRHAFKNSNITLVIDNNPYVEAYAKKHKIMIEKHH